VLAIMPNRRTKNRSEYPRHFLVQIVNILIFTSGLTGSFGQYRTALWAITALSTNAPRAYTKTVLHTSS
jgi:hypothetical protein